MKLKAEFAKYRGFVVDCDGVVWRGEKVLEGAVEALRALAESGRRLVFLTNNSTRTREEYARRLRELGLSVSEEQVVTSGYVAARVLAEMGGGSVFVVGEEGLVEELRAAGLRVVRGRLEAGVDYVVVGLDRSFDYWKMAAAMSYLKRGALFIATNTDATVPSEEGELPGAGSIVSAIATCAERGPDLVVGKPNPRPFEIALEKLGLEREEVLVVGDRLETDIAGAAELGLDSALVLTGVAREDDVAEGRPKPTYVLDGLADVLE